MEIQDTLNLAASTLKTANIGFALIGGFALAAHGVVRATQDIDLLVDGKKKEETKKVLLQAGFSLSYGNAEVMHLSGKGQLDILFANRELTSDMIRRARPINGFPVSVVSAEDLIGLKIQAYKNDSKREFKDKADIQSLLEQREDLDDELIKKYADLFGEWEFIRRLKENL